MMSTKDKKTLKKELKLKKKALDKKIKSLDDTEKPSMVEEKNANLLKKVAYLEKELLYANADELKAKNENLSLLVNELKFEKSVTDDLNHELKAVMRTLAYDNQRLYNANKELENRIREIILH